MKRKITTKPLSHLTKTRIYRIWCGILDRCNRPNGPNYSRYGGRGISVCEEWRFFCNFYNDMKEGYSDELSIERVENDKGYFKDNCRWATRTEQARNRRTNHYFEYNGERLTLAGWCEKLNVDYALVRNRLKKGWTEELALFTPKIKHGHTLSNMKIAD
jgi:hypothetical protein